MELIFQFFFRALANKIGILVLKRPCFGDLIPDHTLCFIPSDFMSQVWSEENTNAYFPRPRGYVALGSNRELAVVNTKYLQNLAYCRLKNLSIVHIAG